jgi:mannose-6-phosphate isomerase-like protein (cupin superfamily)
VSYPPALYEGERGEVSATHRPAGSEPDLVYPNGVRVHHLSRGADTGGLFGLYRWDFSTATSGPGPHFHRTLTESFFVLSGTVSVYDGNGWKDARPGDYLHVPAGGLHGFRNESGEEASMLLHFAPGAPREDYFAGLARLAAGEEWSEEEYADFMWRHDNHWVE